jgi:hypothetical protein
MRLEIYVNLELCSKEEGRLYDKIFAIAWKEEAKKTNEILRRRKDKGVYHSDAEYALMRAGNLEGYNYRPMQYKLK